MLIILQELSTSLWLGISWTFRVPPVMRNEHTETLLLCYVAISGLVVLSLASMPLSRGIPAPSSEEQSFQEKCSGCDDGPRGVCGPDCAPRGLLGSYPSPSSSFD
jgi:hypothetical protein